MIAGISGIMQVLPLFVLAIVALIHLSRVRRDWLHRRGLGLYSGFGGGIWFCYLIVQWFLR